MGSFWTALGVHAATFRVKRLNHGKPRILLEKRSPGAHGGGQDVAILGGLGPKICPKSTHAALKHAKRHTKTRRRGSRGHRRGQRGPQGSPRGKKLVFLGSPGYAGGATEPQVNPRETHLPPTPPVGRASSAHPPRVSVETQSLRLLRDSTDTLRLSKDSRTAHTPDRRMTGSALAT